MTRRVVWFSVLALALLVFGAVGFTKFFEQVPVKKHEPPQGEARRNPYLALERFMAQMGQALQRSDDAQFLDHLPAGGVIILDANRRTHMTPNRLANLLAWVGKGGYLITTPEMRGADPLLSHFDISRLEKPGGKKQVPEKVEEDDENDEEGDEKKEAPKQEAPKTAPTPATPVKRPPKTVTVNIPNSGRPLTADFRYTGITTGDIEPEWAIEDPDFGDQLLHFSEGAGHVTVVSHLSLFNNMSIGRQDHAELLWTLIQTYQPAAGSNITLMTRLHLPSLREWLTTTAWAASLAALMLLLLWLWRVVPRFGPASPEPELERRQIREHLTAVGRYLWRSGGTAYWLKVSRDAFLARLAARHPAIAALPPERQAESLAQLTRRPLAMVATALYGQGLSIHEFTAAVRTLRSLERSI